MNHVIVTGGSRGLGLAIVKALLTDGCRVSTCSRSWSSELERLSADPDLAPRLFWRACALGDATSVSDFMSEAMSAAAADIDRPPLYALLNNAGVARDGVLATFPEVEIDSLISANLTGALQMARTFLREKLVVGGDGRIVNISSIVGLRGYTGLAVYAATKAGLDGMTRALAREVGRRRITVNSVAPGYLTTELSTGLSSEQRAQIVRRTPLGRLGTTEDVVALVRFLLSPQAGFITGQTLVVDGGLTC